MSAGAKPYLPNSNSLTNLPPRQNIAVGRRIFMVYFGSYEGRSARNKTQLRFFFKSFPQSVHDQITLRMGL